MSRSSSSRMMTSASSGTTSQAIFSITSRLALESASRSRDSPPSAEAAAGFAAWGGTTLSDGLGAAAGAGTGGSGGGAGAGTSSSSSIGMSSSTSSGGGG